MFYKNDGAESRMGNYSYAWVRPIAECFRYASPEIRKEIYTRIEKEIEYEEKRIKSLTEVSYCDMSHVVDMAQYNGWGPNYLYVWLDEKGWPFYVGKGRETSRLLQYEYKTRSVAFQEKIRKGGCHVCMIAKNISDGDIDAWERELIAYLYCSGYKLLNEKDKPNSEQVIMRNMFMRCQDAEKVSRSVGYDVAALWEEYEQLAEDLSEVYKVLEEIIGAIWTGGCADLTPKEKKPGKTLIYNGIEKTYAEWAKEPGVTVTVGAIRTRVEKNGWSPHDALFTPSLQAIRGTPEEKRRIWDSYREKAQPV